MKTNKSQARSGRRNASENRVRRVKQIAGLVLMLVCLMGAGPVGPAVKARSQETDSSSIPAGTATLLENGKVLVAGLGSDSIHSSAALYDPATRTWSGTGSLTTSRFSHTATLLQSGKVLVAGGDDLKYYPNDDNPITSAEVYDPAIGNWSSTGDLNIAREGHTATLLPNGKVLVVGGYYSEKSAELYDPETGTWLLTGDLDTGRTGHTATLLSNGKVLIVGGCEGGGISATSLTSAELYDPANGTWSYTGSLNTPRSDQTATLLRSGEVLVAGGSIGGNGSITVSCSPVTNSAELYDAATGTWGYTGKLNTSRVEHTATLLPNGKVLIAGGDSVTCTPNSSTAWILYTSEVYDPEAGTWSRSADLGVRRSGHTATLLPDGTVLMSGGSAGGAEVYDAAVPATTPIIKSASVSGKKLFVIGRNFDDGAVILLNGEEQDTETYEGPRPTLIAKKSGKKIRPGDKVQVQNPNGTLSQEFIFSGVD
jgi:N-acetylneuraminic acid mutarotase